MTSRAVGGQTDQSATADGQLLDRFITSRDGDAFAVLVHRHSAMVWGVCRRVLRNAQDAEDAFQATFLVLARKAAAVSPREMVANWLYGVARQTALKAGAAAAKRRVRERQVAEFPEPAVDEPDLWPDLRPLLDHELTRLPDKYRVAVVLCGLEGMTREEAARHLGLPEGTVASRLARARAMLARRLIRYGLKVSVGALAAALSTGRASAAVPTALVPSTITAASVFAAGESAAAGVITPSVAQLTEGVLKTMFVTKLKTMTLLVLAGAGLLAGGWLMYAVAVLEPAAQGDGDKIQGTWTAESIEDGGRPRNFDNPKVVVTRDKLAIKSGDKVEVEATYVLDPARTPKWIDLKDGDKTMLGIYELDGDKLKICLNEDPDRGGRPTKFASEADSPNDLLIVLKRDK